LEMVIGILAVLKSGGAYLPIDLGYPQERIDYILKDSGSEIILSQRQVMEAGNVALPEDKVCFIDLSEGLYENGPDINLRSQISPKNLAYVLYTSGTTGNPKGVMMDHFSVSIRILYMIDRSNITASDFYLFKTNYVFDVSVSDIFGHLCAGAKLQITRHLFDLNELNGLLYTYRFTSIHVVPSQYDLISPAINSCGMSKVYFSGEAITPDILSKINRNIDILNYYGPTETGEITVSAPSAPEEAHVIGKIFPHSLYYVLDPKGNPKPVGVIGELYIGGAGLSRGYLNSPDLTGERYVKNPFVTASDKSAAEGVMSKEDTRLYKTGDLVRWLPDGNLEYIGRNDDQVKIRGYRIELGEIEHALLQIDGIKQACVLAKEKRTESGRFKYLVGYYVPDNRENAITPTTITNELLRVLPAYMVPAALVSMDLFPLTINGKMDKRALPDPELSSAANEYVEPVTEIEKSICRVWQDVLGTDRVGITDNFFSIGGNSIVAIQVSHRVSKALGYEVKVADVFKYPTICQLLRYHSNKYVKTYVEGEL
jgi:amino acid adenylation domain-containing protein